MGRVRMTRAVLCLCLLQVVIVKAGLFTRNELTKLAIAHTELPSNPSRDQAPRSAEPLIQGRQRTLFARRGVYERQRVHAPKPKVFPAPPNRPPPKAAPNPVSPRCSQLSESCLPQSRCCDPCATCHCRFFNAICFCRKTNSLCEKKT